MASLPPVYEDHIPCARADYPPQVHSIEFLGQVHDADKYRNYARTHGCSTLLNYEPVFLFNDTFEISPAPRFARMQYTPIASITAAFGSLSNPTVTTYPTYTDCRHIPQFIPFSRAEKAAGATRGCYLTVFNSVVQVPGKEFGVVWFMKMRGDRGGGGSAGVFCGVGVAEVKIDAEGALGCDRKEELVFDGFGPRWGDISTVLHGDYIYLYGSGAPIAFANDGTCNDPVYQATHPTTTDESKPDVPIYLCRVPYRNRAYWHAENYKYWNGEGFVDFPRASQSLVPPFYYQKGRFIPSPDFKCVMKNVQSGTVMHSQLFTERGHFIFIGCELDSSGDDDKKKKKEAMVKMRIADEPMGPWFGEASLFDLNSANSGNKGVRFGVHAHPWASDLKNGEIIVSWTEPWPGTVEMAKVKLVMQPSPPRVMESTATATTAATAIAYYSRHRRNNARAAISDCFDEEPILEDTEPESEPELEPEPEPKPEPEPEPDPEPELEPEPEEEEVEVDPEQKLCNRDKARNKALAKLAGQYNREEDSDPDTESVYDFKKAFEKLLAPPGCSSPSPSFEEELTASILRPYSGYDLRTIVPNDISGSWILGETDCHYPDDAFDNNRNSLDDNRDNNQGEKIPPLLSQRELEEQAAAAKDANHNSSSTNSSPQTNNHSSSFWLHDSDTNTEYSTSVSPVSSSPIAIAAGNPPHHYPPPPPDPDPYGYAYPYPPPYGSPPPPPIPGTEFSMVGSPLSVFDTHSSSQTAATTIRRGKKKYAVKKLLWGKKDQAQAQAPAEQAQEQGQVEGGIGDGGGNEKKGWKNSLKKMAIAKFLKGGGGSA